MPIPKHSICTAFHNILLYIVHFACALCLAKFTNSQTIYKYLAVYTSIILILLQVTGEAFIVSMPWEKVVNLVIVAL